MFPRIVKPLSILLGATPGFLSELPRAFALPNPPFVIPPRNPEAPARLAAVQHRSVLVVGGGLAGLSAALELAERGYSVTLREADDVLGGRLATRRLDTGGAGEFNVEHGLHMWFDNYHNFRDIRRRLKIDEYFRAYNKVHFLFRDYKPEVLESAPPVYPLNLLALLQRSPNLGFLDAATQIRMMADVAFFNYRSNDERFDEMTFFEWADSRGINKKFFDVLLEPAASVTLNLPSQMSAAEMLHMMHYYFIGQPKAMNREVTTVDHGTAVIDPWARHLRALGVDIRTSSPVRGLRFRDGKAVGEAGAGEEFDWVVLATDIPAAQGILSASIATDPVSRVALDKLQYGMGAMRIAPPYKVMRVWFDRPLNPDRPDILETPQHRPINLLAQFHLLEQESATWARRTGGSVLEFHLYTTPEFVGLSDGEVWDRIRPVVHELLPELASARILGRTVGSYHNFTSYEIGQSSARPYAETPMTRWGATNLTVAGDWVKTTYPSALMERAVSTGRDAANQILVRDGIRQAPQTATSLNGPGLF